MNLNKVLSLLFIGLLKGSVFGQEFPNPKSYELIQDLDEVIVTATRTQRQLSSVPLPVTLIAKKQLQKQE